MADITYRFAEMESAAVEVDGYVDQYKQAAQTLIESLNSITSKWEGESKDKFTSLVNGAVQEYIVDSIPQIVSVIAAEIRQSSENMSQVCDSGRW